MKPEPQKRGNTGLFINIPTPYFKKALNSFCCGNSTCHSRGGGNPSFSLWTPAFAGVTLLVFVFHNRY